MKAIVKGYEKDKVILEVIQDKCGSCKKCNNSKRVSILKIKNKKFYPINSEVSLIISSNKLLLISFIMYGMPVIIFLISLVIGSVLLTELIGSVVGILLVIIYYFLINKNDEYFSLFTPKIKE